MAPRGSNHPENALSGGRARPSLIEAGDWLFLSNFCTLYV